MNLGVTDGLLLAAVGSSAAGLFWLSRRKRPAQSPTTAHPVAAPARTCPPGFLPALDASALFTEVRADPLLLRIRQSLGFAPENFARDVAPLLDQVAEFVQLLPASESHHHANPGGLLTHLLEVAAVALLRCEETKLPVGRPTEEQLKHAARWRYGVLVAALFHDVGKPIADVIVDVLTPKGAVAQWNGHGGRIGDYGDCYGVRFPLAHDYTAHQRLPIMLLKSMVPASTLRWLADDPELLATLIAYLSSEADGGHIGRLVKEADRKSVADNLLNGTRTRFASARQVPLIERMMDGLRRMLDDGAQLPLNREGAAGFCDGIDMWFVAGTVADKVRAYLEKNEIREAGAADLPSDNSRLFDVWLDYGAVSPNAGAAIWRVQVTIEKTDGKAWTQAFTMLRFPLEKLYQNPGKYPAKLTGRVETVAATAAAIDAVQDSAKGESASPSTGAAEPPPAAPLEATTSSDAPAAASEPPTAENRPDFDLAPVSIDFDATPALSSAIKEEFLDDSDSASSIAAEVAPKPVAAAPTLVVTAPVAPAQMRVPENSVAGSAPQPDPEVERMMAWLQQGVGNGSIAYNRSSAAVHFVPAGMLLISPKIFRDFLNANGASEGSGADVKRLQRLLQKSGYVAKNRPNSFLHCYRIINAKNPDRAIIFGYLVDAPRVFFNPVPEANVHLEPSPGNEAS